MYVIFEGVDTSGKSTQVELLGKKAGVHVTKEPGGTPLGTQLRSLILSGKYEISKSAEAFLFLSDRAEHYEKVVKKHDFVISDRGFISGIAYALVNDENLDVQKLLELNKMALGGAFCDKIVFFKTTKELIKQRLGANMNANIENRGIEYLITVQDAMQKLIDLLDIPVLFFDSNDFLS